MSSEIKKAYLIPLEELIKRGSSMEKEAVNLNQLGQVAGRGARYLGEGLHNIAFGGRGGLEAKQVLDPMLQGKLTKIKEKWDPWFGVKNIGRVRQVQKTGPLKGMYNYSTRGKDEYLYNALPKPGTANVLQRLQNLPKTMWQEVRGGSPTRADQILRSLAAKEKMSPGAYLKKNPSIVKDLEKSQKNFKHFVTEHPGDALKYYPKKALWGSLMVGLPSYEMYGALKGEGDPTKSKEENLGSSVGSSLGFLGAAPMGWVGVPLTMGLGSVAGSAIGKKLHRMRAGSVDEDFNAFLRAQGLDGQYQEPVWQDPYSMSS